MHLLFHPVAKQHLQALHDDPAKADLLGKIVRTVRTLRDDPGSAEVRRQAWATEAFGQAWVVPVRDADDDWMIVWTPGDPDTIHVLYVGPDPR